MTKSTSAHMCPCKLGSSEIHNKREKELSYVRSELSNMNEQKILQSISERMEKIQQVYHQVTGQKLQPSANPIQETVLVIDSDTTMLQVEAFGELCRQELGITPFQYYIHRDEGHYDTKTGEWKPNYHAHILFDITSQEHKIVERTVKKNGKNVKGPDGKPLKKKVDSYGKTIKLTPSDMSKMQDLAAQATGLDRGISSDKIHLTAQRYKAEVLQQELRQLKQDLEKRKIENQSLTMENSSLRKEVAALKVVETIKSTTTNVLNRVADSVGVSPKVKQLEESLSITSSKLKLAQEQIDDQDVKIATLTMENATIKRNIASMSNKVTELSSLNIRLRKALEKTISFLFQIVPDVLMPDSLKETIKNALGEKGLNRLCNLTNSIRYKKKI